MYLKKICFESKRVKIYNNDLINSPFIQLDPNKRNMP